MSEKMREEFETWARSRSMDLEYRNIPGVGQFYECPRTLLALEAWQASRAAVVVELPESFHADGDGFWMVRRSEVKQIIEALGLKVTHRGPRP